MSVFLAKSGPSCAQLTDYTHTYLCGTRFKIQIKWWLMRIVQNLCKSFGAYLSVPYFYFMWYWTLWGSMLIQTACTGTNIQTITKECQIQVFSPWLIGLFFAIFVTFFNWWMDMLFRRNTLTKAQNKKEAMTVEDWSDSGNLTNLVI